MLATFFVREVGPIAFRQTKAKLTPATFFGEQHQLIYTAMREVDDAGKPVDLNTVRSQMKASGSLERAGGAIYLADLTNNRPALDNIVAYVDTLAEKHEQREFAAWLDITKVESHDVTNFRRWREEKLREATRTAYAHGSNVQLHHIGPVVEASMSGAQNRRKGAIPTATPTGYAGLDAATSGGIGNGDLWVVAGRPGSGKTSAILGIAANIGRPVPEDAPLFVPRLGVALFELEMQEVQVPDRIICMRSNVALARWRAGKLNDEDMVLAGFHAGELRASNFWIDDSPAHTITLDEVEAKLVAAKAEWDRPATFAGCPTCGRAYIHSPEIDRWFCAVCVPDPRAADFADRIIDEPVQLTREQRISVAMIDHVGLLKAAEEEHSREREVAKITGGSKAMAKRLGIGVVDVSQLSREADKREGKDKKPRLSDLRESGAIEQDADAILFPFRPGYYKPDDAKIQHQAEWILAKQRNGPPCTIPMRWVKECARFDDEDTSLPEGL